MKINLEEKIATLITLFNNSEYWCFVPQVASFQDFVSTDFLLGIRNGSKNYLPESSRRKRWTFFKTDWTTIWLRQHAFKPFRFIEETRSELTKLIVTATHRIRRPDGLSDTGCTVLDTRSRRTQTIIFTTIKRRKMIVMSWLNWLNDTTIYCLLDTDPTAKAETKINKTLKTLQEM